VRKELFQYSKDLSKMRSQVGVLGSEKDSEKLRDTLNHTTDDLKEQSRQLGDKLVVMKQNSSGRSGSLRRQTYDKLWKNYTESMAAYKKLTSESLSRQRMFVEARRTEIKKLQGSGRKGRGRGRGGAVLASESSEFDGSIHGDESQRLIEKENLDARIAHNEALIEEREEEIVNVSQTIAEINEMFKDFASQVHSQGEQLDSIEVNTTRAEDRTDKAAVELGKASKYQSAARKKMCYILLMLVVCSTIAIIFIFSMTKKK
jgi:t-SNARE complex subunit (syntaxin)